MKTLSVIIPVYNEEKTIYTVLSSISKVPLSIKKEVIIVDDGSTDNTKEEISRFLKNKKREEKTIFRVFSKKNGGKGSAVKRGFKEATGEILIIQDADLEYNPNEYQDVINPILNGSCEVVYGSRSLNKENEYSNISFFLGGKLVTFITNLLFLSSLTDEPTCYKAFSSSLVRKINIESDGFEWEPEITAKILKEGVKIQEVPISYKPRRVEEGKKINWRDGIKAIWTLIYWRLKSS